MGAMQRGLMSAFNGGMREAERGALGLPQDKLVLVREKKEDIERVSVRHPIHTCTLLCSM